MSKGRPTSSQAKIIVWLFFGLIAAFCIISVWNPGEEEKRVLESNGIESAEISTLAFWGCPDDQYGYHFKGKNNRGKDVQGVMCKNGLFLGSWNVRYN